MNQPSGAPRPDFADCRQSTRANGSPETNLRNCQKLSPCPTRRRPCTPCATVEATRFAAISNGGRRAPSASAVSALLVMHHPLLSGGSPPTARGGWFLDPALDSQVSSVTT